MKKIILLVVLGVVSCGKIKQLYEKNLFSSWVASESNGLSFLPKSFNLTHCKFDTDCNLNKLTTWSNTVTSGSIVLSGTQSAGTFEFTVDDRTNRKFEGNYSKSTNTLELCNVIGCRKYK